MSWAAHDIEPYLMRAKLGIAISLPFALLGSYSPDILTKWMVYGLDWGGHAKVVDDPVQLHRGWPGVGFTHSLAFGAAVAGLIYLLSHQRLWAVSFMLGNWAHVLSDSLDSVGVMVLWPLSTWHLHLGVWEYVGQLGRSRDAVAYYTSLGGVWDAIWVVLLLLSWKTLTTQHFRERIFPRDPFWPWLKRKTNEAVCLAVYRASAFFGVASVVGWFLWVFLVNDFEPRLDWSLGAPHWAPRQGPP